MLRKLLFITCITSGAIVLSASSSAHVQKCPTVSVSCPGGTRAGQPRVFTAQVQGGDSTVQPTYEWTVSAGKILSGQGTFVLTVEVNEDETMTATVKVGGFAADCATTASCTGPIALAPPPSWKFGEYNPTSLKAKRMLDEFAGEVKKKDDIVAHVIGYGGSSRNKNEAQLAGERARNYLIGTGIWQGRIEIIDGGFRDEATVELWVTPKGATPPKAGACQRCQE